MLRGLPSLTTRGGGYWLTYSLLLNHKALKSWEQGHLPTSPFWAGCLAHAPRAEHCPPFPDEVSESEW